MRQRLARAICSSCRHCAQQRRHFVQSSRRAVQISPVPSSTDQVRIIGSSSSNNGGATPTAGLSQEHVFGLQELTLESDARFEVLGSPSSLLSASVSASQNLYTRRGTLVGFNGKAENALSTLSVLSPILRAPFGVPFLYQRITSTTPFTALIGAKSLLTSMAIIHLDGRLDWMVAQRNALLAWTGHTLTLSPRANLKLPMAHWGKTSLTGRGLVALAGKGQIHQVHLGAGDEYVVHPSNVVAYSITQHAPQPYRFKATAMRLNVPNVTAWLPDTRFWNEMRKTTAWRWARAVYLAIRTSARRTIWGDKLFLHFRGPVNILIQSRGSTLSEVLTTRDINEIADSPAGVVSSARTLPAHDNNATTNKAPTHTNISIARVKGDGKVEFEDGKPAQ